MPYIGKSPNFGVRNRFVYVADADDTSVSGADANGATLTFTDGAFVDVYLNGVLLKPTTDYNTSTANTIAGISAMAASDEVTVVVYDVFAVGDTVSAVNGGTFVGDVAMSGTLGVTGATTTAAITASGVIKTDDTTDSTSTTTGSIQTDGGVGIAKDLVVGDDIILKSDAGAIQFGADSEITLTHSSDSGLLLKHAASGDDKFLNLTLQTGDTDIAVNDVLGQINFQAPDEGAGTDAVLRGASIRAISEGDFSASNNATTLEFMTGATATPTRRMRISSTGETTITTGGSVTDHGGLLRLNGTYSSGGYGPNIMFHGTASSQYPSMQILNYSHDDQTINFDAWHGAGGWKSSASTGNLSFGKRSDKMQMWRKSGVSANSAISWVQFIEGVLDNGQMTFTANINSVSHYMKNVHGTSPYGMYLQFDNAAPDNNDNYFLRCRDSGTNRMTVFSDGDVNTSDAGTLSSDSKNKNTITDASSKYDDVKKLKVRNFYWNEDYHPNKKDKKMIGFIAQEFAEVFPGLVSEMKDKEPVQVDNPDEPLTFYEDGDTIPSGKKIGDPKTYGKKQEEKDLGTTTKTIREGKLIPILTKALQECMAKIETLEAKVKTLEEA